MTLTETLKKKTRADLVRILHAFVMVVFVAEIITLFVEYEIGGLSCTVPRYIFRHMLLTLTWNIIMSIVTKKINDSRKIDESKKDVMIVFCVVKICAATAIVHSYYAPTQCVFACAIMAAAMLGELKLITFAFCDSLFMMTFSMTMAPLFNQTTPIRTQMETMFISILILLLITVFSYAFVMTTRRHITVLEKYAHNLEQKSREAKLDSMTLLYNHAEFYAILHRMAEKPNNHIFVALMDIDNFKSINDTYGHDNGDKVILKIAEVIRPINDDILVFASRYGGEEFAFIFINKSKSEVINTLQTVRSAIGSYEFDFDTAKSITLSCGVFECVSGNYSAEDMFTKADMALYFSKEHGRNRLTMHDDICLSPKE